MPHIHTKAGHHDLTASAFIIRTDGTEPRAVLHLHKKLGKLIQFGGHVELHENPWQAVTHEIAEESGYQLSELQLLQPKQRVAVFKDSMQHPYPVILHTHQFADTEHFHTDVGFAFIASGPPQHPPNHDESQDIRLFTFKELKKLSNTQIPDNVRQTFLFVLTECYANWERIPAPSVA